MKILGIIPARYASTRFPGKPLALIKGKPMIEWVYQNAAKSTLIDELIVATDDNLIATVVKQFGGQTMMTSTNHTTGTERCAELIQKSSNNTAFDIIINIQGDEPLIQASQIDVLIRLMKKDIVNIGTLVYPSENRADITNLNRVKVLFKDTGLAFRFARQLPNVRLKLPFYLHKGLYGFKRKTLLELIKLPATVNEQQEQLEQLRWLDHGYSIYVDKIDEAGVSVDIPEDIGLVEQEIISKNNNINLS